MLKVAIVEDDSKAVECLRQYFEQYTKETGTEFQITDYPNAVIFLSNSRERYDIVCMDIEMPHMNGMEAAHKFRETDSQAVLIFVTNLAQYAIQGYEVDALGYILKPLKYSTFRFNIRKAEKRCAERGSNDIEISRKSSTVRLPVSAIRYVEIQDHNILYHTEQGPIESYGTMKKVEESMPPRQFARCNNCYLVNLAYVTKVEKTSIWVGDEELSMSRPRRKTFLDALHEYYANR